MLNDLPHPAKVQGHCSLSVGMLVKRSLQRDGLDKCGSVRACHTPNGATVTDMHAGAVVTAAVITIMRSKRQNSDY